MIIPKTKRNNYIYKTGGVDCSHSLHQGDKFSVLVKRDGDDVHGRAKYVCKNCDKGEFK